MLITVIEQIQQSLGEAQRQLDELTVQIARGQQLESPDAHANGVAPQADDGVLARPILGATLAADPAIADDRRELISSVIANESAALALAGRLLLFRAAQAEQMPPQLKEIGEAFYRWSNDSRCSAITLRDALVRMLVDACDDAGIPHSIELARVGDRFDRMRHHAAGAGVELANVRGWVVLRENGSVYTKAAVAVK